MKRTLLVLAIIAISGLTFGQHWVSQGLGWTTTSRGVMNVFATSSTVAWAGGYDGSGSSAACQDVAVTTDGGNTWTPHVVSGATGLSVAMIAALDETTAWAAMYKTSGGTQGVYKTTDGGATWARQGSSSMFTASASFPDALYFWDANNGCAIGDPISGKFEIYTTNDGGTTWTMVSPASLPAITTGEAGWTVDCGVHGNNIWFGTNKGHIYRSPDKGLTWTAVTIPNMAGKNTWPAFKDDLNGYCMKFYSTTDTLNLLAKSTDGGVTYTAATYGGSLFNNQLTFVPGTTSTYVASGVDATNQATRIGIVYSFDDGANFNAIDPDLQGTQVTTQATFNDSTMYAGSFSTGTTDGIYVCHVPVVAAVANFTSNTQAVVKGGTVLFTNTSTGNATSPTTYLWTFQGGTPATSTSKNPSAITYNTPGTYNVTLKVSNAFGSINSNLKTGYIYVGGVGVDELSQGGIKVYPNPVKDIMNVEAGSGIQQIQLFNVTGQMVINKQVDSKTVTLNTSSLKAGIYMLKVTTETGTSERKVVVQ